MRFIIRVTGIVAQDREHGRKFARAVADLVRDGHFLTVIHGHTASLEPLSAVTGRESANGNGNHCDPAACARFAAVERENRVIVMLLAESGVASLGLRATDLNLVQLRRQFVRNDPRFSVEAARLNSCWLELICHNKGVPVLSNFASWTGGQDHLIDPDQMSAICAADWKADALIYVTEENGVPGADGDILRWLNIESNGGIHSAVLSDEMRGRLDACAMALKHGVRRVRILPLSNVDCLPQFYFSPIRYGTEVIAVAPRI